MKANFSLAVLFILVILGMSTPLEAQNKGEEKFGDLRGTVNIKIHGVLMKDLGPIVVYLEYVDEKLRNDMSIEQKFVNIDQISQKLANFVPDFITVTIGQTVEFPNNDSITHNVFSYSKPNDFDLGLYPKGTSKSVTFQSPGVVRIYCAIHKSMKGTIFVAPTRFHTLASSSGSFEILNIPMGSFRLKTWNNILPESSQKIDVLSGQVSNISISVKGR